MKYTLATYTKKWEGETDKSLISWLLILGFDYDLNKIIDLKRTAKTDSKEHITVFGVDSKGNILHYRKGKSRLDLLKFGSKHDS